MLKLENTICFLGAYPCVGTTMIAQSVAETLASHDIKTLFLSCNALSGCNFVSTDSIGTLDTYKSQLQNELITETEINSLLVKEGNLDILPGAMSIKDRYMYQPEDMEHLLAKIANRYDKIIIDCDIIDRGLTIGSLSISKKGFYIVTQQPGVLEAAMLQKKEKIFGLFPENTQIIVNKYQEDDMRVLLEQIRMDLSLKADPWTIPYTAYGWQAEHDKKTMLAYDKAFQAQIAKIASDIAGKPIAEGKRRFFGWRK